MLGLFSKLPKPKLNFQLPQKYHGTIIHKWFKYWEGLVKDYTDVFKDTVKDIYAKPLKAVMYGAAGGFCSYAAYTNPEEMDYRMRIVEYQNSYGLVGKPVRNPSAGDYLKFLQNSYNYGLIRRFSFGVFSIIWVDDYDDSLGLFKAQCEYLKPQFKTFHERVIDVGFLNKFWVLESKMVDYDVNPNEWIDFSKKEYVYRHRIAS